MDRDGEEERAQGTENAQTSTWNDEVEVEEEEETEEVE